MGDPDQWDALLADVKREGFDGVESCFHFVPDIEKWVRLVRKHGLRMINQVHTCRYTPRPDASACSGGQLDQSYVASTDVREHLSDLRAQLALCKAHGSELVNVHGGHDSWGDEEAVRYLLGALRAAEEVGIRMVHETHRRRLFWNPWQAARLLDRVPAARLNADLSHWCCVCERVMGADTDPAWPGILQQLAGRCDLIHARVGCNEGPQVPHPAAPEYTFEVAEHSKWWAAIWEAKVAADGEDAELFVEPEFGAPGYQRLRPFSCRPVEDLWEINSFMAGHLIQLFNTTFPRSKREMPERLAAVREAALGRRARAAAATGGAVAKPAAAPGGGSGGGFLFGMLLMATGLGVGFYFGRFRR